MPEKIPPLPDGEIKRINDKDKPKPDNRPQPTIDIDPPTPTNPSKPDNTDTEDGDRGVWITDI
jgi:hypothetical protein